MQKMTFLIPFAVATIFTGNARGSISSVHETVFYPACKPSVNAAFEQTRLSTTTKVCSFLTLNGDASKQEHSDWQTRLVATQSLALAHVAPVLSQEGTRQDEIDLQGRVRRSTWTWDNGMVHQIVLFDEAGRILQLDRWRNQRWVPDDMAPAMTCGPGIVRSLAMRVLNGVSRSGQVDLEITALEKLADKTTNYSLTNELNLSGDVCSPSGQKASEAVLVPNNTLFSTSAGSEEITAAGVSRGLGPKQTPTVGKLLVIAPNPSIDRVEAFYDLYSEAIVVLNIVNIGGDSVATYSLGDQGAGSHSFVFEVNKLSSGPYIATLIVNNGGGHKVLTQFRFAVKH